MKFYKVLELKKNWIRKFGKKFMKKKFENKKKSERTIKKKLKNLSFNLIVKKNYSKILKKIYI